MIEAITAYQAAIEELKQERSPAFWAQARQEMAIAFLYLYRRTGSDEFSKSGIAAAEDALKVYRGSKLVALSAYAERIRAAILAAKPEASAQPDAP